MNSSVSTPITPTGPRMRRRGRLAVLLMLLTLALGAGVMASAAGLGGLHPQGLGAATTSTKTLSSLDVHWTPQWHRDAWRAGDVTLTAAPDRGFQPGDTIEVTVQSGGDLCEANDVVTSVERSVRLNGEQFSGCALANDATAAIVVTGADGESMSSTLGEFRGSLAAFSTPLFHPDRPLNPQTDTTVSGQQDHIMALHLDVPGARVSDVAGGFLAVVLPGVGQSSGVISPSLGEPVHAQVDEGGTRITMTLTEPWPIEGAVDIHAALATSQHLTAASGSGAITTLTWAVDAEPVTPPPAQVGSALDPVRLSPGIEYQYDTAWDGYHGRNELTYSHAFTITNTTDSTIGDWTVQFDTSLPPLWGADPTVPGAIDLAWPLQTADFNAGTGLWTIRGKADGHSLAPGESRQFVYHAHQVPTPEPDPATFDTTVGVSGDVWHGEFTVEVTSTSQFQVPWSLEIDLGDLVCAEVLQAHPPVFERVDAAAVPGSSTRYRLTGKPGDTQLVSETHSREFVFARFEPHGSDWQVPCAGGPP